MLSPQKFFQVVSRAKSATGLLHLLMGGLKLRLSRDFLQLPPVQSGSFAGPCLEAASSSAKRSSRPPKSSTKKVEAIAMDSEEDDESKEERRCGLDTFRRISDIVCLTRIVRAPNSLGAVCTCARAPHHR